MIDPATQRLFSLIDTFWLLWIGSYVFVCLLVRQVLDAPAQFAPDQAACIAGLPKLAGFSTAGWMMFWGGFAVEVAPCAVLLMLAHQVVQRCATGQIFVVPTIAALPRSGFVIAAFPVISLILENLSVWLFVRTGDMIAFSGNLALDAPVIGVGLLLITMVLAMRVAVQMHEDAALTI